MTKIVILDAFTANPGDLSWKEIEQLGEVSIYDRTKQEHILTRAKDAEVILTNKVPMTKEIFEQLPNLKFISVLATGYNIIDLGEANKRGISVSNVPVYSTDSVAQYVMAAVLHFTNQLAAHSKDVHQGGWTNVPDFSYWFTPQTELVGKKFGIIGFGKIGQRVGELAHALGMKVSAWNRSGLKDSTYPVDFVELDNLLESSDFITVHIPQTQNNEGMFDKELFSKMKKGAVFINSARGGLVDEQALIEALEENHLAGAAIDVLAKEPMPKDCPLMGVPNLLLTPHMAWATIESRARLIQITVENIKAYKDGKPINVVNDPG